MILDSGRRCGTSSRSRVVSGEQSERGHFMARAEAAHASARSDSIKGLAQSIAKPAYRRLLTAEPALRRAVPALIIAFLITIAVGAFVQVLDHRRSALADASKDIETIAEVLCAAARASAQRRPRQCLAARADRTRSGPHAAHHRWRPPDSGHQSRGHGDRRRAEYRGHHRTQADSTSWAIRSR